MEELGKQIAETIIEQSAKTIGLYPGSFKVPHKAHLEVAKRAAQHVDELHIIISNNIREGYTPEVSLKVWKQYLPLLPENVKVKIATSNSPITEIYNIVKDKTNNYIVIYGKGEKDRYNSINENRDKYSNVDIIDAGNFNDISATSLREAIKTRNKLAIKSLIPEGIKVDDFLMNFQIHEIKINTPGSKSVGDVINLIKQIREKYRTLQSNDQLYYINKIEDIKDKYGDVIAFRNTKEFLEALSEKELNKIYKELESLSKLDEIKVNQPVDFKKLKSRMQEFFKYATKTLFPPQFSTKYDGRYDSYIERVNNSSTPEDLYSVIKDMHKAQGLGDGDALDFIELLKSGKENFWLINEIKVNTPGVSLEKFSELATSKVPSKVWDIWNEYGLKDLSPKTFEAFYDSLTPQQRMEVYKRMEEIPLWNPQEIDEEKIPGGLASGLTLQDIADKHKANISSLRKQLQKGIKVELEHTTSKDVAEEIAMDHLFEDPKYYDKLATIENDTIDEAKQVGDVYHFTNLNNLESILKSNKFHGSTTEVDKFNPDFRSFRKKESDYKDKGIGDVNYFSTTRDKNLWKKDPKIGGSSVRIKIDGNKLSNNFKVQPFYYYSDEMSSEEPAIKHSQDESEERINLGTKTEIPNAQNYIKEINILLDKMGDNTRILKLIQDLQTKYPQIKTLYKDKEMSVGEYNSEILPTIEPYHDVDEIKINKPGFITDLKDLNPGELYKYSSEDKRFTDEIIKFEKIRDEDPDDIFGVATPINSKNINPNNGEIQKIILNPGDIFVKISKNINESKLLKENIEVNPKLYIQLLDKLTTECCKELGIEKPKVYIINNPKYTDEHHSYGGYLPASNEIKLVIHGRDCMSSVRSLSHELKHAADASQGLLTPDAGKDGDEFENSANSYSGKTCRWFGRKYPKAFFLRYD